MSTLTRVSALLALTGAALSPALAAAAPPPAEAFDIRYQITGPDGALVREMDEADRYSFTNRARCECGQQIAAEIRVQPEASFDQGLMIDAMVGTQCASAEQDPLGQFKRCGMLKSSPLVDYVKGVVAEFHPIFLASGITPGSVNRNPADPAIVAAAASCDSQGESGVWICTQTNSIGGCQSEEFIIGDVLKNDQAPQVRYDFAPPISMPTDLSVEAGDGSVMVSWELEQIGDIAGFRVLCEEADGGAPVGLGIAAPDLNATTRDHYFNAHNLCGDQPFSSVTFSDPDMPGAEICGDGRLDTGEQCDDGEDNHDEGLCSTACRLRVGDGLHALDWDHLCSGHVAYNETSVAIGGLENGKTYNFVLVAHDLFGNPRTFARVVAATPDAELQEFAPAAEDGCGCSSTGGHVPGAMLGLIALAAVRRRRGRARG
jgi:MYXO-CTERM domain-containing protein